VIERERENEKFGTVTHQRRLAVSCTGELAPFRYKLQIKKHHGIEIHFLCAKFNKHCRTATRYLRLSWGVSSPISFQSDERSPTSAISSTRANFTLDGRRTRIEHTNLEYGNRAWKFIQENFIGSLSTSIRWERVSRQRVRPFHFSPRCNLSRVEKRKSKKKNHEILQRSQGLSKKRWLCVSERTLMVNITWCRVYPAIASINRVTMARFVMER